MKLRFTRGSPDFDTTYHLEHGRELRRAKLQMAGKCNCHRRGLRREAKEIETKWIVHSAQWPTTTNHALFLATLVGHRDTKLDLSPVHWWLPVVCKSAIMYYLECYVTKISILCALYLTDHMQSNDLPCRTCTSDGPAICACPAMRMQRKKEKCL